MHNITTSQVSTLPSITSDLLLSVSGGCGRRRRGCCPRPAPAVMQQIVQLPPAAAPVLPTAPASAPAQPQAVASGPTGDIVTTNVSINGVRTA